MNSEKRERGSGIEVAKGIGSCFVLNLLHLGIAWLMVGVLGGYSNFFFGIGYNLIAGFGLLQLVYVIPLVFSLATSGRTGFAKGMAIGAAFAFLLSATCWGLFGLGKIKIFG